jgi:hypothetical protein
MKALEGINIAIKESFKLGIDLNKAISISSDWTVRVLMDGMPPNSWEWEATQLERLVEFRHKDFKTVFIYAKQ